MNSPPAARLTERQREIYEFLRETIHGQGFGPTIREIAAHFDIASPNGVVCHLKALEHKGLITRGNNLARAIRLVDGSDGRLPVRGTIRGGRVEAETGGSTPLDLPGLLAKASHLLTVGDDSLSARQIASGDCLLIDSDREPRDEGLAVTASGRLVDTHQTDGRWQWRPVDGGDPLAPGSHPLAGVVLAVIRPI